MERPSRSLRKMSHRPSARARRMSRRHERLQLEPVKAKAVRHPMTTSVLSVWAWEHQEP
jgi:hypothetical protein